MPSQGVPLKFGVFVGQPSPPFEEILRLGIRCEKSGFDSFWFADHLMSPPPERCIVADGFTVLAAMATHTNRITLGTSVTCVHRRHPYLLAQAVSTLDHLSKGRAILGLGSGEAMNLAPIQVPWDRPVARTLEAVELIKQLWKENYLFDFDGEFYQIKQGFLQLEPYQKPHPPVYYAANGKRTLRLLGQYWEGWLPVLETPKTYGKHVDIIEMGARESGRSIKDVDCCLPIFTAVSGESEDAWSTLRPWGIFLATLPKKLEEAGYHLKELQGISRDNYFDELLVTREDHNSYMKAGEFITEEMIRDFFIAGTVDECIDRIEMFRDAGMDHLLLMNLDPNDDSTLGFYENEIIPYFKE